MLGKFLTSDILSHLQNPSDLQLLTSYGLFCAAISGTCDLTFLRILQEVFILVTPKSYTFKVYFEYTT